MSETSTAEETRTVGGAFWHPVASVLLTIFITTILTAVAAFAYSQLTSTQPCVPVQWLPVLCLRPMELQHDLVIAILANFVLAYCLVWWRLNHKLSKSFGTIDKFHQKLVLATNRSADLVASIRIHLGLDRLASSANSLPHELRHRFAELTNHLPEKGGGIIIHCMQKDYLAYLNELSGATQETLRLTLRGGEKPVYTPEWFFTDDTLASKDKLDWLRSVRGAGITDKKRLMMFSEADIRAFFLNEPEKRRLLIDAMIGGDKTSPMKVYLVDPKLIHDLMKAQHGEEECRIVFDDFAIFDKRVVLKHNGASSLTVGINGQIELYNEVFATFDKLAPGKYKQITAEHFGNMTWDEWTTVERTKGGSP